MPWVAADLLVALGKRRDVTGVGRDADDDWALAHVWLTATAINDLLVTGFAALPPPDILNRLLLLACGADVRLWLVADQAADQLHVDVLAHWPVTPVPRASFDAHWTARRAAHHDAEDATQESVDERWPAAVPDVALVRSHVLGSPSMSS